MKKLYSILILISASLISTGQVKDDLKTIADALREYQTYQAMCEYTFSAPFGDTMTCQLQLTTEKVDNDGLTGFNYSIITEESYRGTKFTDFSLYFDSTVYTSYLNKVEKVSYNYSPSQFIGIKLKNGYIHPVHEKPTVYKYTPYKIADKLDEILNDTTYKVQRLNDTVFESNLCKSYLIKYNKSSNNRGIEKYVDIEYVLLVDKGSSHIRLFSYSMNSSFVGQMSQAIFRNPKVNEGLEENYFSEEHLLPPDWEKGLDEEIVERVKAKDLIGTKAPKWKLPMLGSDKLMSNKDLRGKYALVEFTATWCGVCYEAAKMMNRLEETFKDNDKVEIISIFSSSYDKRSNIEKFAAKLEISIPILYDAVEVGDKYKVHGYPDIFLISPEGVILNVFGGWSSDTEDSIVEALTKLTSE